MNFTPAQRAQVPNYMEAYIKQAEIANALRQAEQARRMQYAAMAAKGYEGMGEAGRAKTLAAFKGGQPAVAGSATPTAALVEPATGAVASAAPQAATAAEVLGTGGAMSAAPSAAAGAAGGAEAAAAAQAAMAATEAGGRRGRRSRRNNGGRNWPGISRNGANGLDCVAWDGIGRHRRTLRGEPCQQITLKHISTRNYYASKRRGYLRSMN